MRELLFELKALWLQMRVGWAITLLDWTIQMLPVERRTHAAHQALMSTVNALQAMLDKEIQHG